MLLDRNGNVKLCDFGISGRLVDSQAFTRNAGCAAYMAVSYVLPKQCTLANISTNCMQHTQHAAHTHLLSHMMHTHSQPERINLEIGKEGYDVRADIWSLGISLVELATGQLPYACSKFTTEFQMLTFIVKAPPPLPEQGKFSPQFYDFLAQW